MHGKIDKIIQIEDNIVYIVFLYHVKEKIF